MAHRFRAGIIGFGIMGERMLQDLRRSEGLEVVAVHDPGPATADRLRAYPGIRPAPSAEHLLADPAIDLVYIATPPASHIPYAHSAFDHGKAVFCEKPLAVDIGQARSLVDRVRKEGLRGGVNFPFATLPAVAAFAEILSAGTLGELRELTIHTAFARWPREWQKAGSWLSGRAEGGFTREVLSHFLFLARRLLGPLDLVSGHASYPAEGAAETAMEASLRAGDVPVAVTAFVGGDADTTLWTLTGSRGAIRIRDWYQAEECRDGRWTPLPGHAPEADAARRAAIRAESLRRMLEGRDNGLATFEEAFDVQRCVEQMLAP